MGLNALHVLPAGAHVFTFPTKGRREADTSNQARTEPRETNASPNAYPSLSQSPNPILLQSLAKTKGSPSPRQQMDMQRLVVVVRSCLKCGT